MAKKTGIRVWRKIAGNTGQSPAGRYKFAVELCDIKAQLEALAGQGEEFQISKALLTVQLQTATALLQKVDIVAVISDQAITIADPGDNNSYSYMDDDLDVQTAGDYESLRVGTLVGKIVLSNLTVSQGTVDVTGVMRKAASLLARSAILATNPYISFIAIGMNSATGYPPSGNSELEIQGVVRQKPLRMLA